VNRNTGDLLSQQLKQEREMMKKMLLSMALAVVAPFAWGQMPRVQQQQQLPQQLPQSQTSTTTTTTTDANGTITEYTPGSAIVLRESNGPVRYRFGKTVTYVTRSGNVLDEGTVRTKVKVGVPVRVHYVGTGDNMMVDRVILDED
jgi:energy-converting hydrogenase Eha subunit F